MWATCQSSLELFIDLLIKFSIYHDIPGHIDLCSTMLALPWCKLLFGLRLQASGFTWPSVLGAGYLLFTPPGIWGLYSMFREYSWKAWSFLKSYWESVVLWNKGGRVRERKGWKEEKMWSGYNVWEWNKIK